MNRARIVLLALMAMAVHSGTLDARADTGLREALYTVYVNGREASRESPLLRDAKGDFYVPDDELDRWQFVRPPEPPIQYRRLPYHAIAAFPGLIVRIDWTRQELDMTAPVSLLRGSDRFVRASLRVKHAPRSYLNYDVSADGGFLRKLTGLFDYGMPIGNGIAAAQIVAQDAATNRRIFLFAASWDHYDAARDRTLRIGDATALGQSFELPFHFEGIQWASRSSRDRLPAGTTSFAYETGWERPTISQTPIALGSFMVDATASRGISDAFTAQAHVFADASNKMMGVSGTWRLGASGQLGFGVAPNTTGAPVEFLTYQASAGRFNAQLDVRTNAEAYQIVSPTLQSTPEPNFGRQLRIDLGLQTSETGSVDLSYVAEALVNSLPSHLLSLSYDAPLGPAHITTTFVNNMVSGELVRGIATTLTFPLDARHAVAFSHDVQPGSPSRTIGIHQSLGSKDIGIGYDIDTAADKSTYTNASFVWQSSGSISRFQFSRFQGGTAWHADVSGGTIFFNGTHHVAQRIEQRYALIALRRQRTLTVRLLNDTGLPLESGSIARTVGDTLQWTVGEDGEVSLTGLDAGEVAVSVSTPSGPCSVTITVPTDLSSSDLGMHFCRRHH